MLGTNFACKPWPPFRATGMREQLLVAGAEQLDSGRLRQTRQQTWWHAFGARSLVRVLRPAFTGHRPAGFSFCIRVCEAVAPVSIRMRADNTVENAVNTSALLACNASSFRVTTASSDGQVIVTGVENGVTRGFCGLLPGFHRQAG
jgi:hypothetical protein